MRVRVTSVGRWVTVLVTIFSWLAVSNHCALGATVLETKTPGKTSACPFHSKPVAPAKEKPSNDSPCCKILRATVAIPAKKFTRLIVDLAHVDLGFAQFIVFAPPKIFFRPATLDTGPPGVTSFAELIGSMLAHAPPHLA
jgi:hypothetical protein